MPGPPITQTSDIAVGDVDGDRDLDFVVSSHVGRGLLFLNDGIGHFSLATSDRFPRDAGDTSYGVDLMDVDADADLDIVFSNSNLLVRVELLLNDGRGFFTDATATNLPPTRYAFCSDTELGDLNGDGSPDMVVGIGSGLTLLFNDSRGRFTDVTSSRFPPAQSAYYWPEIGDVDGDADLDFLAMDYWGKAHLYVNDGRGTFADATASHLPAVLLEAGRVYLRDLDGDGDLDLLAATSVNPPTFLGEEQVLENDGLGHFTDQTARFMPLVKDGGTLHAAIGDVDGDHDLDFLLPDLGGNGAYALCYTRLYLNLTRQIYAAGPAKIGQSYPLTLYGSAGLLGVAFVAASETTGLVVPPFGTFRLPLQAHMLLPPVTIGATGSGIVQLQLPNDLSLVGQRIHSQGFLIDSANPARSRLTNVMADTIKR
jgi:hypothetical protein